MHGGNGGDILKTTESHRRRVYSLSVDTGTAAPHRVSDGSSQALTATKAYTVRPSRMKSTPMQRLATFEPKFDEFEFLRRKLRWQRNRIEEALLRST